MAFGASDRNYAFIYDYNQTCVAHGANPGLIGRRLEDIISGIERFDGILNGTQLHLGFVAAAEKGGAWVDYNWINAGDTKSYLKLAYVVKVQREGREYYLGVGLSDVPLMHDKDMPCTPFYNNMCTRDWALSVAGSRMSTIVKAKSHSELQAALESTHETSNGLSAGGSPYGFASIVFNEMNVLASAHWKGNSTSTWLLDAGLTSREFAREDPEGLWLGPLAFSNSPSDTREPHMIYHISLGILDEVADGVLDGGYDTYHIIVPVRQFPSPPALPPALPPQFPSPPALPPPGSPPPPGPPPLPPDYTWLRVLIASVLSVLLLGLATFAWKEKQRRWKQFLEKLEGRSCDGAFVPLIYKLKPETEFKLEESERKARRRVSGALSSLTKEISKVRSELEKERDDRIDRITSVEKDELIKQSKEASASAAVYEVVFDQLIKPDKEGMAEYERAANQLRCELPKELEKVKCRQAQHELAKLYVEAVSVKRSANSVLKKLCAGAAQVETSLRASSNASSRKDSADGRWRLQPAPLKKMRCVLQASESSSPPLITVSCVRGCSRACEKIVLQAPCAESKGGGCSVGAEPSGLHPGAAKRQKTRRPEAPSWLTKMNSELWHKQSSAPSAERICDIVRFMFVCKTMKDMATLLDQFRESNDIDVVRFKDRIKEPNGGWRDAMINFRVKDHICEVQIVHQRMALCRRKDGLGGHDEYAQQRNACEILEYLESHDLSEPWHWQPAEPLSV